MDTGKLTVEIDANKDTLFAEALAIGGDALIADELNRVDPAVLIEVPRSLVLQDVLALLVEKGILKQEEIDGLVALIHRPGSRAEQLYGPGRKVTHTEVAVALGRGSL